VATVHAALDPAVPLADSVGALAQLRQESKIAAIGLSNVTVAQLDEALAMTEIAAVQNRLSYARPGDLPTAPACAERNVAYLAYAPGSGPSGPLPATALAIARRRGVSAHRVLLASLRAQSPAIGPLAGASKPGSIRDSATPFVLMDLDFADLRA
jgi:aryl-alcohol dehydrogenase-like predicted oxidoreductase